MKQLGTHILERTEKERIYICTKCGMYVWSGYLGYWVVNNGDPGYFGVGICPDQISCDEWIIREIIK